MKQLMIFIFISFLTNISAQKSVDDILIQIEKNNTTLSALRKNSDAQKAGNKTGIFLQNPELEFNYLWGTPSAIGNRTDFSIKQSFDFPTAYSYKKQISNLMNEQVELEYQKQLKAVQLQTRLVCIELTYQNALKTEFSKRLANATQIVNAYQSKFNIGEIGILEYNKARVILLTTLKDAEMNEIERDALRSELAKLNGGVIIGFNDSVFLQPTISIDFEQWYAQIEQGNPMLQWIKTEILISEKQKRLTVATNLPQFNAGYMSEKVAGQQFQGVSVGMTIPLWESKNTVKFAKANAIAVQSLEDDAKSQFYHQMKAIHLKAVSLQKSVTDYRQKMITFSNADLLLKALNQGEISLSEYLFELSLQYDSIDRLLDMEKKQQMAFAELSQYF